MRVFTPQNFGAPDTKVAELVKRLNERLRVIVASEGEKDGPITSTPSKRDEDESTDSAGDAS